MRKIGFLMILVFTGLLSIDGQNRPQKSRMVRFVIETRSGDGVVSRMVVATSNKIVISKARKQLSLPRERRELFILGNIARGDGGHNQPWSWHFIPNGWNLVEISAEVCDGSPQYVEDDLEYWLRLGYFCPWSSRVVAELPRTLQ